MKAFITLIFLFAIGCDHSGSSDSYYFPNGKLIQDQDLVSQIISSPKSITINNIKYSLESFAWRDYMPGRNPNDWINASNTLVREDGKTIKDNFSIVQQYVIKDQEIWIPFNIDVRLNLSNTSRLIIVSREGPTWDVDTKVDFGLKFKSPDTGAVFWLSTSSIPIARTD